LLHILGDANRTSHPSGSSENRILFHPGSIAALEASQYRLVSNCSDLCYLILLVPTLFGSYNPGNSLQSNCQQWRMAQRPIRSGGLISNPYAGSTGHRQTYAKQRVTENTSPVLNM